MIVGERWYDVHRAGRADARRSGCPVQGRSVLKRASMPTCGPCGPGLRYRWRKACVALDGSSTSSRFRSGLRELTVRGFESHLQPVPPNSQRSALSAQLPTWDLADPQTRKSAHRMIVYLSFAPVHLLFFAATSVHHRANVPFHETSIDELRPQHGEPDRDGRQAGCRRRYRCRRESRRGWRSLPSTNGGRQA
jgi:hypothetical protein